MPFPSERIAEPEPLTPREEEAYRLSVVNRLTGAAIAERMGVSPQRVSQLLSDARNKMPPPDPDALRKEANAMLVDIQRRALELAEREGAPITAGKDGDLVIDPASGEYVRDYSLRLAALKEARSAGAEIRKLYGLDAATKTEVTGSVRYEVAGVDLEALS